jgi:hypothetical protein
LSKITGVFWVADILDSCSIEIASLPSPITPYRNCNKDVDTHLASSNESLAATLYLQYGIPFDLTVQVISYHVLDMAYSQQSQQIHFIVDPVCQIENLFSVLTNFTHLNHLTVHTSQGGIAINAY